jgi:two-component system OmpR family sensor kinase
MKWLFAYCRHPWRAVGLRGRLVAGYSVVFAAVLLAIAFGETTIVRQVLVDDRKAELARAADDLTSFLSPETVMQGSVQGVTRVIANFSQGSVSGGGVKGAMTPSVAAKELVVTGDSGLVLALLTTNGSVVSRTSGADVDNVDPRALLEATQVAHTSGASSTYERAISGTTYLVQVRTLQVAETFRSQSVAMAAAGQTRGASPQILDVPVAPAVGGGVKVMQLTALAAASLRPVDDTVNTLLLVTLTASALGLILAATAGLAVARRVLHPLQHMTAMAQAIAAGGDGALDQRLHLPAQGDEVGRLAGTFDQMLDRIQSTIAERERSETRLRHFAADASHELRTPLAAVSGYTEVLLLGGKDDPKIAGHVLHQMEGELARMNRLIGDLLMLARLEAGIPVHLQALPLMPLLEGLLEKARVLAAGAGHKLVIEAGTQTGEAAGLTVLADPDRLQQIMLNLLHNAVKFTPDGGRITVGGAQVNGNVAIAVTDTGPGIAAEELPLLFERFYRGDKARTRGSDGDAGGAGLGLAIAQGLAQAQGGRIDMASTPGAGSTFTVVLPAAPDAA